MVHRYILLCKIKYGIDLRVRLYNISLNIQYMFINIVNQCESVYGEKENQKWGFTSVFSLPNVFFMDNYFIQ